MGEVIGYTTPSTAASRPLPVREDCWSEEATSTLVDAWGQRYMDLNRGNFRQKDWQEVADAVNALHGGGGDKKSRRTDVQCKNRMDTLKKKYKAQKARVSEPGGALDSPWPFFSRLDMLIGSTLTAKKPSPAPPFIAPSAHQKPSSAALFQSPPLPKKRPSPAAADDSYLRRNYSAIATAVAAAAEEESDGEDECGDVRSGEEIEGTEAADGMMRLARVIERFGETYERVEGEKQRQMIELEKQRMQFAKDLEVQRMQLFMDTQVRLEKIKQAKRSGSLDMHR